MAARDDITAQYVRERLDYDPETGVFTWKNLASTPENSGWVDSWNLRFEGKPAGSPGKRGHLCIALDNKKYYAHRLAWLIVYGLWPIDEIDHIDGDKINNRITNLRAATHSQNAHNRSKNNNNKSGFKGVTWQSHAQKWRADIMVEGETLNLGYFCTKEEAAEAYADAAHRLHGEFAKT